MEQINIVRGRLVSAPRIHGKSGFVHVFSNGVRLQLFSNVEASFWEDFRNLNQGDLVEVTGSYFVTRTGEETLRLDSLNLLRKCEIGLPSKVDGLGLEVARKSPYLNLLSEVVSADGEMPYRETIILRAKVLMCIREFLHNKGYIEVQTPILVKNGFGCDAKPFQTEDYYLRIAPELELKKLIVGGFERIYEIGKNFRNEGLSQRHNPEFTMLEFYCSYGNYSDAIRETHELLNYVVCKCFGSSVVRDIHWNDFTLKDGDFNEELLYQPTYVRPKEESPLAKHKDGKAERFELYVKGMEIANGYSEQDDWREQLKAFEQQGFVDEEYINALKAGLPPTFGVGIGIDRLLMLLTGRNIKEVL